MIIHRRLFFIQALRYVAVPGIFALLAAIAMPAAAGAATASTTISSAIGSVISVFTTSGTVNVDVTPTGAGAQTIAADTVTVSTNDSSGYTLQLADSDATTTLVSGPNTIAASTGTQSVPTVETAGFWGYRVDGVGGFGAGPTTGASSTAISGTIKFAGVPVSGSPNTLATTASTATNATTSVWYGVAANTSQPTGTYTDSVTYTCTAN